MSTASTFVSELKKDLREKEHYPLKIINFFNQGSLSALFPFVTIHAKSFGITVGELGVIFSFLPLVGIFAPCIAGLLGDRFGNFKVFLSLLFGISGVSSLLFYTTPLARIELKLPESLPLDICCSSDGHATIQVSAMSVEHYDCDYLNSTSLEYEVKECILASRLGGPRTLSGNVQIESLEPFIDQLIYNEELSLLRTSKLSDLCPNIKKVIDHEKRHGFKNSIREGSINERCRLHCQVVSPSRYICSNDKYMEVRNPTLTSAIFGLARIVNGLLVASSMVLMDSVIIAVTQKNQGDIGLQRLFCQLGMLVFTPISGYLIDVFSTESQKNYLPAYIIYIVCKTLCALTTLFLDLEFKKSSRNVFSGFKELLLLPEVAFFVLFTGVNGLCFGFVETFLFWYLEDLKATKLLMGLTVTVGSFAGLPLLLFASLFIRKFGHVNTLAFCLAVFSIRLIGYSMIENPWFAMPYEALECITVALSTVASMSYIGELSTSMTVATLQGIYNGFTYGIGKGLGSLVGGNLIHMIGIRSTMQILGGISGLSSLLYLALNYTLIPGWKSKREQLNDKKRKEQLDLETMKDKIDA